MGREGGSKDQFPVGMRVLAVDDDPTCLKVLEALLHRCQYHVTTTGQAITALKLLRENKDKFDLVISDVHMPDMDGFKLLELVGLEMDLPVIMLSGNGETQAVMKGISHGACDYLLKPVRIEELRNIWQHVIRRRKFDTRDHGNFDNEEDCEKNQIANLDKLNRKRKEHNEEDLDECEENMLENEDPSAPKKPRVVWSVELHRKFVAAVNYLGIDKAVPKKILDIMNVEKLTRENVASHLQKYRLYLRRLSAVASQQANMVAAFGNRNPSYLPTSSLEGFRNFHSLVDARQLPALTSFQPNSVLGRMNNITGFGQHNLPSGTLQHARIQSNPVNDFGKLQGIGLLRNSHENFLKGIPMSLEQDRLQQQKTVMETNNHSPAGFSVSGLPADSSISSFANMTNNSVLVQENQQHMQSAILGSHSSDSFKNGLVDSSNLADLGRYNCMWQSGLASTKYSTKTLPVAGTSNHSNISPGNILSGATPIISHMDKNIHEVSSSRSLMAPLHDSMVGNNIQYATSRDGNALLIPRGGDEDSKFLSNSTQKWEEQKLTHAHYPNSLFGSSFNSPLPNLHTTDAINVTPTPNNRLSNEKTGVTMIGQNFGVPFFAQECKNGIQPNYKEDYILENAKLHNWFSPNAGTFDDLMNGMIKQELNEVNLFDGEMASDVFSLGTCM